MQLEVKHKTTAYSFRKGSNFGRIFFRNIISLWMSVNYMAPSCAYYTTFQCAKKKKKINIKP